MNSETRENVKEIVVEAGALERCPQCGEPHIATEDEAFVVIAIKAVKAARAEGDLSLIGMTDVEGNVRAVIRDEDKECPLDPEPVKGD